MASSRMRLPCSAVDVSSKGGVGVMVLGESELGASRWVGGGSVGAEEKLTGSAVSRSRASARRAA
ncbi:hypothetical protein FH972_025564 [Carpinus fangiana]|uniref:Uncharacterized protein n=1 Tax=Carpinus fangiana TaxID=176857 RepID=A0A5N6L1T6_9ROSI|nr:hypothetical protein FH972_025564 [Carpinus fangiana]